MLIWGDEIVLNLDYDSGSQLRKNIFKDHWIIYFPTTELFVVYKLYLNKAAF